MPEFMPCATADACIHIHINAAAATVPNIFSLYLIFSPLVLSLKVLTREI